MKTLRINERAWAVDVISEINRFAASRQCPIKSAGGEVDVSAVDIAVPEERHMLIIGGN